MKLTPSGWKFLVDGRLPAWVAIALRRGLRLVATAGAPLVVLSALLGVAKDVVGALNLSDEGKSA